ncbi:hypothetical protein H8E77_35320 [bacterium]|nr:hypothetical protein [bacterium]
MKYQVFIFFSLTMFLWFTGCSSESIEKPKDSEAPMPPKVHLYNPTISDDNQGPYALTETDGIHIEWDANEEDDITEYKIYRSNQSDEGYQLIATLSKDELFYEDMDVRVETKYYYRVVAVDQNKNESNMSQAISYTLLHKAVLREPPNQSVVRTSAPVFKWLEVNNAQGYVVRVFVNMEDTATPWQEIWKSREVFPFDELKLSYNENNQATETLEDGKQYRWRVDASGGQTVGSKSNYYHFSVEL